jgi:hypothetical protein
MVAVRRTWTDSIGPYPVEEFASRLADDADLRAAVDSAFAAGWRAGRAEGVLEATGIQKRRMLPPSPTNQADVQQGHPPGSYFASDADASRMRSEVPDV